MTTEELIDSLEFHSRDEECEVEVLLPGGGELSGLVSRRASAENGEIKLVVELY